MKNEVMSGKSAALFVANTARFSVTSKQTMAAFVTFEMNKVGLKRLS